MLVSDHGFSLGAYEAIIWVGDMSNSGSRLTNSLNMVVLHHNFGVSLFGGLEWTTGLLEWTTGTLEWTTTGALEWITGTYFITRLKYRTHSY